MMKLKYLAMMVATVLVLAPAAFAQGAEPAAAGQQRAVGHRRGLRHGHRGVWMRHGAGKSGSGGLRRHCAQPGGGGSHSRGHDSRTGVRRDIGAVHASR